MSLIAAYAFNESGLHDYSGNKNHLVNTAVTFSATTATNGGFGFDAVFNSSSTAVCSTFPSPSSLTGLTVFCNVNFTSLNTVVAGIAGAWAISINASGNIVFVIKQSSLITRTVTSATALTTGTWHTIACVWDGTNIYIYIDGVLDASHDGAITLAAGSGGLIIGNSSLADLLNMFEVRSIALNAVQVAALNQSPGGMLYTIDLHNFVTGDLVADASVASQGVVTWVIDHANFYAYPFVSTSFYGMAKYGNVCNTNRQTIMEISNDFDGNGNSQISIKYPIASFADYASPANILTFDYNGYTGPAGGDLTGTYPNPTVGANKITYAKMQQASSVVLLGNPNGSTANLQEIILGTGLSFSGTTLVATGSGSVSSVGLADGSSSAIYTVTGSPVTGSGTLTFTLKTQSANTILSGPYSGSAAQPTFRQLGQNDIPNPIPAGANLYLFYNY